MMAVIVEQNKIDENSATNHHCTCVEINAMGIMIEGASGAGKTSLGLGLINAARIRGVSFEFICDDQAILFTRSTDAEISQLWARVPDAIAGKVEIFGAGIAAIEYKKQTRINLVCELVKPEKIERYPLITRCQRLGIDLDYVQIPMRNETHAVRILLQKLALPL